MVTVAKRRVGLALAVALLVVAAGAVWLTRSSPSPTESTARERDLLRLSVPVPGEPSERSYHAHVPERLPDHPPVVMFLHGSGRSGPQLATSPADFQGLADRYRFIAVFPSGVEGTSAKGFTGGWWNAGQCVAPPPEPCRQLPRTPLRTQIAAVDDVAYLREVIDDVAQRYETDSRRVYAWGHSLGGFMAHRLACDLADRVAAVAVFAGALTRNPCAPSRPVSILVFQTLDDDDTPTDGNQLFAPIADTVAAWMTINGCRRPEKLAPTPDYSIERATCQDGTAVEYVLLDEGGHNWMHTAEPVFDWFPHTWQFLQAHPLD